MKRYHRVIKVENDNYLIPIMRSPQCDDRITFIDEHFNRVVRLSLAGLTAFSKSYELFVKSEKFDLRVVPILP